MILGPSRGTRFDPAEEVEHVRGAQAVRDEHHFLAI